MKHRITRAASVLAVATLLSTATVAPASAGHTWSSPERGWICSWFPYWCD